MNSLETRMTHYFLKSGNTIFSQHLFKTNKIIIWFIEFTREQKYYHASLIQLWNIANVIHFELNSNGHPVVCVWEF